MIQDIVLPVTGDAGDAAALADAIALAAGQDAHLAVLQLVSLPAPTIGPLGLSPDYLYSDLYTQLRQRGDEDAAALRTRLQREAISHEVRVVETMASDPPYPLPLHARHADLCLLPGPGADPNPRLHDFFGAFLFASGRPVLVVPPDREADMAFRHAVVAWKPTREATRAVHDALPLLQRCRSVDIVVVDPKAGISEQGEEPGSGIAVHLARHGLDVNVVSRPSAGAGIAAVLLRHCMETDAQLLVSGGYGHSRMREWALGGTTRELLEQLSLPVLFSH